MELALIAATAELIEVGIASWALEAESGDAYVVASFADGVLVAVIDGLGDGPDAARAARTAQAALRAGSGEAVELLLRRCHEALRRTRGAVVSLAVIEAAGRMTWAGVGNVEAAVIARRASRPAKLLANRGGILGHRQPAVRADSLMLDPGDALVFATDGLRSGSIELAGPSGMPQATADRILADGATGRDDALALVARYLGTQP